MRSVQIPGVHPAELPLERLGAGSGNISIYNARMSHTDCPIALSFVVLGAALLTVGAQLAVGQPRMVDIGSRKLYLDCSGPLNSPVVILEAGSEAASESWRRVQPKIAISNRVCSYDRAGLGKSPWAGHEESVAENVADLHSLLQKAKIQPPYVLVAHSSGGLRARQFQSRFPAEVIGMVLADSAHEEQIWRFNDAIPGATRGIPEDREGLARMGLLPPRERLQWRVTIPLIVIEHGKPGQLPPEAQAQAELPLSATTPYAGSVVEQGGKLYQQASYQDGQAHAYASNIPTLGGIAAGTYPTPGGPNTTGGTGATYLSLNISGNDAANFMTGQFVTPQFVTDQAMAAQYSSYGRTQQSANMQLPGLTVA